jgi:hypothetical protein
MAETKRMTCEQVVGYLLEADRVAQLESEADAVGGIVPSATVQTLVAPRETEQPGVPQERDCASDTSRTP